MEKKIIGYKAPCELYNGDIKKGTLYRPCSSTKVTTYVAMKEDGYTIFHSGRTNLPKEIVETWEPVYKEEEFKVGDIVTYYSEVNGKTIIDKIKEYTPNSYCKLEGGTEPFKHLLKLASKEEKKEYENNLLLEEAKLKYPKGTNFKCFSSEERSVSTGNFRIAYGIYKEKENPIVRVAETDLAVYDVIGNWATILPSYPQITINNYEGEFFYNYVKFGCAKMQKNLFTDLYKWIEGSSENTNRNIESVTIGKGTFTKEQIKEIAEYYLNK